MVWKATGRSDACDIIREHVRGVRTSEDVAKCELRVPGREGLYHHLKTKSKLASLQASWSAHMRRIAGTPEPPSLVVVGRVALKSRSVRLELRSGVRASSRADSESAA